MLTLVQNVVLEEQNAENRKSLDIVLQCIDILLYLIRDILDMGKKSFKSLNIMMEHTTIREIISKVIDLFSFQMKNKGVFFMSEVLMDLDTTLLTDCNRVQQILFNLLSNALKYTRSGGFVKLGVYPETQEKQGFAKFSVSDNGVGIPEHRKPYLFKLFAQVEEGRDKEGCGLGLSICQSLIAHLNPTNGKTKGIQFFSEENKGSDFFFFLPIGKNDETEICDELYYDSVDKRINQYSGAIAKKFIAHKKVPETQSEQARSSNSMSLGESPILNCRKEKVKKYEGPRIPLVLIVDDDPTCTLAMEIQVRHLGFHFKTAYNGKEALEVIKKQSDLKQNFDLILLDCNMPIMDGFQTAQAVISMSENDEIPSIPMIATTANVHSTDVEKCKSAGMKYYLSKPIRPLDLAKLCEEILHTSLTSFD